MLKKFLAISILAFIFASPHAAFAALSAQTTWDVRGTGAATNGGGFVPGVGTTDVTTSATLSIDATVNVMVTSSAHNFVTIDGKKYISITAGTGFTPGLYQIRSTSSNAAILDRSPGVAGSTSGTYSLYSGIDYSQQDAANSSGSNISTTDVVANGTTTITSLTGAFTNNLNGNVIYLAGGSGSLAGGWHQATYVSATSMTVDASVAAGTAITMNIGGALDSPATALTASIAHNKVWFKTNTYTTATTLTLAAAGNNLFNSLYNQWTAYSTTRGDNGMATFQASANGMTSLVSITGAYWRLSNIIADCNSKTTCTAININSGGEALYNVVAENFTVHGITMPNTNGNWNDVTYSEVKGGVSGCTDGINQGQGFEAYNYVHDNACTGIVNSSNLTTLVKNISINNSGASSDGFSTPGVGAILIDNIAYNNGRDGIRVTSFYAVNTILNNILTSNGGYGLNFSSGTGAPAQPEFDGNAYYNNTLGARHNADDGGIVNGVDGSSPYVNTRDKILTGSPFTNAAGGDFSLNNTAGAGGALRASGLPQGWPNLGTTTGYPDFGPVQHKQIGPTGGSYTFGG